MVICRSCENELSEDANFCPKCGLRTEKGENDNVRTPIDRRAELEKEIELAIQNATKLLEEAVETAKKGLKQISEELKTELEKVKETRTKKNNTIYCPKCGAKLPIDSEYCTKCGTKIHL
jgi:ribosomal protein L40E